MNESKIPGSPPVVMASYEASANEVNVLINRRQPRRRHPSGYPGCEKPGGSGRSAWIWFY